MSTSQNKAIFNKALANAPDQFRKKIVDSYTEIKYRHSNAAASGTYDVVGISAGKFSESVLRLLQHILLNQSTPFGVHIRNFPDECRKIITSPAANGPESLRIIIPRALVFLYTMRGKRGIGHVGGDVEANRIDIATIVRVCDWIMCELLRVFHNMPLEDAQALIDSLAAKSLPVIWEVGGKKRVLRTNISYKQKVLLLLYAEAESSALLEELFTWTEHSQISAFRRDVLRPLHKDKLIEYDETEEIIYISPLGLAEVEESLLDTSTIFEN